MQRVGLTAEGRRCGETHPRARISDAVVRALRDLHELEGWSVARIAEHSGLTFSVVKKIVFYERRVATVMTWRSSDAVMRAR